MVVPAMDFIDETFTNGILNETELDPAIQTAIKLAKKTLNHYYGLTDASEVYRIAMGEYSSIYKDQKPDNDSLSHVDVQYSTLDLKTPKNTKGARAHLQESN